MHRSLVFTATIALSLLCAVSSAQLPSGWKAHDLARPQPKIVKPAEKVGDAPSDAVVLFDGSNMDAWQSGKGKEATWKIVDGAMESVPGGGFVFSKEKFGDCQLHVEFASPSKVKGDGQGRGNSGVFLMGEFEIQVLDSFDNATYPDGQAGSIYGQFPPLVNASRGPGEWQSYDIIYRRPRLDEDGKVAKPAKVTVLHNGVLIQDSSEPFGGTSWIQFKNYDKMKGKTEGPISLQDHGNPVRYRNIWVRKLPESRALPETPYREKSFDLTEEQANNLVGKYKGTEVKVIDGKPHLQFGGGWLTMVPHSASDFSFLQSAGGVIFELGEDGKAKSFEMKLDAAGQRKGERK